MESLLARRSTLSSLKVHYCGPECQALHWPKHHLECAAHAFEAPTASTLASEAHTHEDEEEEEEEEQQQVVVEQQGPTVTVDERLWEGAEAAGWTLKVRGELAASRSRPTTAPHPRRPYGLRLAESTGRRIDTTLAPRPATRRRARHAGVQRLALQVLCAQRAAVHQQAQRPGLRLWPRWRGRGRRGVGVDGVAMATLGGRLRDR